MLIDLTRAPLPDGYGYIAGEPPDGLVVDGAAPVQAVIDLFDTDSRTWLRSTVSAVDGTYSFPVLPVAGNYFAIARPPNPAYKYEVQENITPEPY